MTGETWRLGYRPWLDGVRGVAVLLVVIQHAGIPSLSLGTVGVSLFFALSGYLITGLLLDEYSRAGRIDLRAFYLRRAGRLLPALLAMIAVSVALLMLIGGSQYVWASVPAVLYLTNYTAVAIGGLPAVFGHTWTLAIEEHFYLVWPALLLVLLRRRVSRATLLRVTLGLCAAALAWRIGLSFVDGAERLIVNGSLERADGLLYGAAAAIAVRLGWRPRAWALHVAVWGILAYVAAGAISSTFAVTVAPVLTPLVLGVSGAVISAALDCGSNLRARAVMSCRPLVAMGLRSYGLYIWHSALLGILVVDGFGEGVVSVVGTVATFAVAWASYRWLEMPAREWVRNRRRSVPVVTKPVRGPLVGEVHAVG